MTLAITPVPVTPVANVDVVRVTVTDAPQSTATGYSGTEVTGMPGTPVQYPASPEVRYYLTFELTGAIRGTSYVFSTDTNGDHEFNNYVFPEAGSWTIRLNDAGDDSSVATQAVTVS